MLFRDDDVNRYADIGTLLRIQALFDKYQKVHTVAIWMEDLWESRGVWEWLATAPVVHTLHCWRHEDYAAMSSDVVYAELQKALCYWDTHHARMGRKLPLTVFHPPWNSVSDAVVDACAALGLTVDAETDPTRVYNFHWWEFTDPTTLSRLEEVLRAN